ncbi:MAG: PQQ-binding-like beta-propeller repeat protein [Roseobacter sp.]
MTGKLQRSASARGVRAGFVLLASLVLLAACAEDDFILPGVREDIRPAPEASEPDTTSEQTNESRAISLGAQTRNTEWPQGYGTPAFRTDHPALSTRPQLAWSTDIGAGDSRRTRITATPVVGAGRIYTLDAETTVTAVSPAGAVIWQKDVSSVRAEGDEATGGGLAFAEGRLFVTLGVGELVALDAASGTEIWRQKLSSTASGPPVVANGLVYLVSGDETGWAISAENGRVQWSLIASPAPSNVLGAPAPAISSDLAVFAFGSGEIQAVFRRGGLRRWDASVAGERPGAAVSKISDVTGAPVIDGNTLYAGNQSGRTVALDLASGSRRWTAPDGATGPIVPGGDSVFFVSDASRLLRVDAGDGSRIWSVDLPRFVKDKPRRRNEIFVHHGPVVAGGRVHIASNDGVLRSYDPVDGAQTASVEIPGGASTDPVVAGATLYVVSTSGQLLAFR